MTSDAPIGMILAAGLGTRMRPLTCALPKPLLPYLNTPIITYTLDHLVRAGARRIGVNLHHLGEKIPPVVEETAAMYRARGIDLEIEFVREEQVRGTAGGIAGIWRAMGEPEATVIAINGDVVMNLQLADQLRDHRASGAEATMLTRPTTANHPGGVLVNDGRVVGLRQTRPGEGQEMEFMGVHLLEPRSLRALTEAVEGAEEASTCMVSHHYIPMLGRGEGPRAGLVDDFWVALDNPNILLEATRRVLSQPDLFHQAPLVPTHGEGLTIINQAALDGGAKLAPPLFLGAHVSGESGARLGPSVVADGTEFAGGVRVHDAVLFGMGRVEGEWSRCVAVNGEIAQI